MPGGFGKRGIQGMIYAIQYAREQRVPFFGICLGMQCATIEYARNVAGLTDAHSTEFDAHTPHRVIYKLRELLGVDEMGGTMRLGAWPCRIERDSFAYRAYGAVEISERHRHRYEFNCDYEQRLTAAGPANHRPHPPMVPTWRLSKWPLIPGLWAANSILSSNRNPLLRIHFSRISWERRAAHRSSPIAPWPRKESTLRSKRQNEADVFTFIPNVQIANPQRPA